MLMQITQINVVFKNSGSFTNCISEINKTQVDNAKDNDIVITILICSKS